MFCKVELRTILLDFVHLSTIAILVVLFGLLRCPGNLMRLLLSRWSVWPCLSSASCAEFHWSIAWLFSEYVQVWLPSWSMVNFDWGSLTAILSEVVLVHRSLDCGLIVCIVLDFISKAGVFVAALSFAILWSTRCTEAVIEVGRGQLLLAVWRLLLCTRLCSLIKFLGVHTILLLVILRFWLILCGLQIRCGFFLLVATSSDTPIAVSTWCMMDFNWSSIGLWVVVLVHHRLRMVRLLLWCLISSLFCSVHFALIAFWWRSVHS